MKLNIISDLHVDFNKYKFENVDNSDVLILAGDTGNAGIAIPLMEKHNVFNQYKHVIMIMGNHEYYVRPYARRSRNTQVYKKDPYQVWNNLKERYNNFHLLNNELLTLDDVTFYGGTMWTSLSNGDDEFESYVVENMNDYKFVTPHYVKQCHNVFKRNFPDSVDVVITHHAPSLNSIPDMFNTDILTSAYYEDMGYYLNKTKLWIHGHVHDTNDYNVNECRVISNPRGYSKNGISENPNFNPNFNIDI